MLTYYDSLNRPHVLTKLLGRGGEGTVYSCDEDFQVVAKIYHEPIGVEKAKKLRWMAEHRDLQLLKVSAWVLDVLTDQPGGKVVGFLMPNVRAKEIHELYSLKSRRVHFPEATWHFLIHTAANLARAFHNLHKQTHVMGDVNHGNCVVLADGTVKLIDCDSYSIKTEDFRYPCEVGVTTHLAPELQGKNLRGIEREEKHDNFGLAVIIFQLLFLGRHPFAGNFMGGEDKSIEDGIREHLFAYGKDAKQKLVAQPPGTLSLSAVTPKVANLFERAFTKDFIRPEPREWIEALEDLADSLEQCSLHPGHLFYKEAVDCPWCEIESQTGLTLFPFILSDSRLMAKYQKSFDIVTVEKLIASFNIQSNLPVKLSENVPTAPVSPAPTIVSRRYEQRTQTLFVCGLYFAGLVLGYLMFGGICAFILSIIALTILYANYSDSGKMLRTEENERLGNLQSQWNKFEAEWAYTLSTSNLEKDLKQVKEKLGEYHLLKAENPQETDKLPPAILSRLQRAEQEIGGLLAALRAGSVQLHRRQQHLLTKSKKLAADLAQSASNVRFLGNPLPIGVILVLITIGTPIFSVFLTSFRNPPRYTPPTYSSAVNGLANITNAVTKATPSPAVIIPSESITDSEIAALPSSQKPLIVNELINRADSYHRSKDYLSAERWLKFALRFDKNNTNLLNRLSDVYYDEKEYPQALVYLKQSKKIADTDTTNFLIGITNLSMERYTVSRDIFLKLANGNMKTNEVYYNLGMSYQGLKNYKEAIKALRTALDYNSGDTDSMYYLGINYNKLGDKENVLKYYYLLKAKDFNRAEDFKKAIGNSVDLAVPPSLTDSDSGIDEPPPPMRKPSDGTGTGRGSGVGSGTGSGSGSGSGSGAASGTGHGYGVGAGTNSNSVRTAGN